LSEGERTELNGLLSVTAGKNRIARTNTWTSLEKGGNIKGNMMLVCTVDSAWEQEKKNKKKHAHPNRCSYSLFRVMPFDLIESFIQTAGEVTGGI
jgi:hypothetical protein